MKKTILIALGMAGGLFLYGYLASSVGHDHSAHGEKGQHAQETVSSENSKHSVHGEHEHAH